MSAETTEAGQRFGLLTAVEKAGRNRFGQIFWRYRCDCGHDVVQACMSVRRGKPDSCGCKYGRPGTNGKRRSEDLAEFWEKPNQVVNKSLVGRRPEYHVWAAMRRRCTDPRHENFERYGGRGIRVCDRWMNGHGGLTGFDCFYQDMGPRPSLSHSIDRRDNDGHYEPENCRWSDLPTQARNKRANRIVEFQGRAMSLAEACELSGVSRHQFRSRLRRGWTEAHALAVAPHGQNA